ncbi:hypothetical protein L9F63_018243, partial [Diploptera punctata]
YKDLNASKNYKHYLGSIVNTLCVLTHDWRTYKWFYNKCNFLTECGLSCYCPKPFNFDLNEVLQKLFIIYTFSVDSIIDFCLFLGTIIHSLPLPQPFKIQIISDKNYVTNLPTKFLLRMICIFLFLLGSKMECSFANLTLNILQILSHYSGCNILCSNLKLMLGIIPHMLSIHRGSFFMIPGSDTISLNIMLVCNLYQSKVGGNLIIDLQTICQLQFLKIQKQSIAW